MSRCDSCTEPSVQRCAHCGSLWCARHVAKACLRCGAPLGFPPHPGRRPSAGGGRKSAVPRAGLPAVAVPKPGTTVWTRTAESPLRTSDGRSRPTGGDVPTRGDRRPSDAPTPPRGVPRTSTVTLPSMDNAEEGGEREERLVMNYGAPFVLPGVIVTTAMCADGSRVVVQPPPKKTFLEVVYTTGVVAKGFLLGAAGGGLVWQERCSPFAERLTGNPDIARHCEIQASRCAHCGEVLPTSEQPVHLSKHHARGFAKLSSTDITCGDFALIGRLEMKSRLGGGAQGDLWLCHDTATGDPIVLKSFTCQDDVEALSIFRHSVRLLSLRHPHIVPYSAVRRQGLSVKLAMPYFSEGDVSRAIRRVKDRFDESYVASLGIQLATALDALRRHTPPLIHGDIKPENILLTSKKQQVVLVDLDAAKELSPLVAEEKAGEGTMQWMSPEASNRKMICLASDVWSLGLVLFVMAALPEFPMLPCPTVDGELRLPNAEEWREEDLMAEVSKALRERRYSKGFTEVVCAMMRKDPTRRPLPRDVERRLSDVVAAQLLGES